MTRPNYDIENYCAGCNIIYPKTVTMCNDCGMRVRTRPHSSVTKQNHLDKRPRI